MHREEWACTTQTFVGTVPTYLFDNRVHSWMWSCCMRPRKPRFWMIPGWWVIDNWRKGIYNCYQYPSVLSLGSGGILGIGDHCCCCCCCFCCFLCFSYYCHYCFCFCYCYCFRYSFCYSSFYSCCYYSYYCSSRSVVLILLLLWQPVAGAQSAYIR